MNRRPVAFCGWIAVIAVGMAGCGAGADAPPHEDALVAEADALAADADAPPDDWGADGPGAPDGELGTPGAEVGSSAGGSGVRVAGSGPVAERLGDAPPPKLLPGEGPVRAYRMLLINALDADAHVFGAAGAEAVALDTVPPLDSVRVDLRVRADMVRLEARDSAGAVLQRSDLALDAEDLNRWIIGEPPAVSGAAAGSGPVAALLGRVAAVAGRSRAVGGRVVTK